MQPTTTLFDFNEITKKLNVSFEELILIGVYAFEECSNEMGRSVDGRMIKRALRIGARHLIQAEKSVTFSKAIDETLKLKSHRRISTLREIKSYINKIISERKGIEKRFMNSFTTNECQKIIDDIFLTPTRKKKARVLLHSIFAIACRKGWCTNNPIENVDIPYIKEKEIAILSFKECQEFTNLISNDKYRECRIPVGLMLYAGIRPYEVERLTWKNINLEEKTILLIPSQTKTGGGRKISIEKKLLKLLISEKELIIEDECINKSKNLFIENISLCPKNWKRKWKELRLELGWSKNGAKGKEWTPDTLRHTFASFHAMYYKDFNRLQYEMGHRSSYLLKTRYVNMNNLTIKEAHAFFNE